MSPADYVITPFGYFSPACVQQIHSGDQITLDGGIQRITGSLEQRKICSQDNFTRDGVRVKPDGRTLEGKLARTMDGNSGEQTKAVHLQKIAHDYLAYGGYITSQPMGRIVASWNVPPNPRVRSNQIIHFFPECRLTQLCSQYYAILENPTPGILVAGIAAKTELCLLVIIYLQSLAIILLVIRTLLASLAWPVIAGILIRKTSPRDAVYD